MKTKIIEAYDTANYGGGMFGGSGGTTFVSLKRMEDLIEIAEKLGKLIIKDRENKKDFAYHVFDGSVDYYYIDHGNKSI